MCDNGTGDNMPQLLTDDHDVMWMDFIVLLTDGRPSVETIACYEIFKTTHQLADALARWKQSGDVVPIWAHGLVDRRIRCCRIVTGWGARRASGPWTIHRSRVEAIEYVAGFS